MTRFHNYNLHIYDHSASGHVFLKKANLNTMAVNYWMAGVVDCLVSHEDVRMEYIQR